MPKAKSYNLITGEENERDLLIEARIAQKAAEAAPPGKGFMQGRYKVGQDAVKAYRKKTDAEKAAIRAAMERHKMTPSGRKKNSAKKEPKSAMEAVDDAVDIANRLNRR